MLDIVHHKTAKTSNRESKRIFEMAGDPKLSF